LSRSPHRTALFALLSLSVCLPVIDLSGPGPDQARAAQPADNLPGSIPKAPAMVSGFPIPFFRTVDYRPRLGSLAGADLDGDGHNELIVLVPSGLVTVIRSDGSRAPGWPRTFDLLPQPAYPVGDPGLGDLDGDGLAEIVVCVAAGPDQRAHLFAFHRDGSDVAGWPIQPAAPGPGPAVCTPSSTLVVDLDGDRRAEVVRAIRGGVITAFSGEGRPLAGWPVQIVPDPFGRRREINADLAFLDTAGDGSQEVAFVESGAAPRLAVVSGSGRFLPGFPRLLAEVTDRHAPVAGDLDGDGSPELIQATLPLTADMMFAASLAAEPGGSEPIAPATIHRLDPGGVEWAGWPVPLVAGGPWGAVLADLDGDGRLDAVQQDGDLLLAVDALGAPLPGFPAPLHRGFVRSDALEWSPWIVGSIESSPRPDLLQAVSSVYRGLAYLRLHAMNARGQRVAGFPFDAPGLLACSRPVLTDLTGTGPNDLALLACDGTSGGWSLIAWDLGVR